MSEVDASRRLTVVPGLCLDPQGSMPIFTCTRDGYTVFYAPRLVCVVPQGLASDAGRYLREFWICRPGGEPTALPGNSVAAQVAARLVRAAQRACAEMGELGRAPFAPECLTLFLNNACNLNCRYCHASPGVVSDPPIHDAAIRAAAGLVAASCAQRRRTFTVAFHGGGEPTLSEVDADRILEVVRNEAQRHGVALRTYVATNGVMPEERALWMASRFDLVGLSCDGPPDIQDRQRPARSGVPTSASIERTADVLKQAGTPYLLRATITRETMRRQRDIVAYFIERFAPTEVRLEPVYTNAARATELGGGDAREFVAGFMEAGCLAIERRIPLTTSLALPALVHGRHCNVVRRVLNLAPGDIATGCFLESRADAIDRRNVRVGSLHPESGRFEPDSVRLGSMLARALEVPAECRNCLCCQQCSHGCPDFCAWDFTSTKEREADLLAGFRCQASKLLMETLIQNAAKTAWCATPDGTSQDVVDPATTVNVAVYRNAEAKAANP